MSTETHNPLAALVRRAPQAVQGFASAVGASVPSTDDLPGDAGTIVGGVVAGLYGQKHGFPVRGAIAGMSIGKNLPLVLSNGGGLRREAACNLLHTGAGILGSFASKKHPGWAFVLSYIASGVAIHYFNLRGEAR